MDITRKPFEGVWNVIRFNWHFYVWFAAALGVLGVAYEYLPEHWHVILMILSVLAIVATLMSLLASWLVYDRSDLYRLNWMQTALSHPPEIMVNINAGFDETSSLLVRQFPKASMCVFDFYDATKHTEVSIQRARKAYPPYPGTEAISTSAIPLPDHSVSVVFAILSAHEIRNHFERAAFFCEIRRILKRDGQVVVVEHLRNWPNFVAYSIGFFHFHSRTTWLDTFAQSGWVVHQEKRITPLVAVFILQKHGTTP